MFRACEPMRMMHMFVCCHVYLEYHLNISKFSGRADRTCGLSDTAQWFASGNQVAALLRDYDIRPVVLHPTKRADFSRHGYRAAHFNDAFARFLPNEPNIRTLKRGRDGM